MILEVEKLQWNNTIRATMLAFFPLLLMSPPATRKWPRCTSTQTVATWGCAAQTARQSIYILFAEKLRHSVSEREGFEEEGRNKGERLGKRQTIQRSLVGRGAFWTTTMVNLTLKAKVVKLQRTH